MRVVIWYDGINLVLVFQFQRWHHKMVCEFYKIMIHRTKHDVMWRVCVHSIYNLYKKKSMTHLIEQSLYRKTFSFRRWFYCNFLLTWISPFSQTTLQHGCSKSFPLDASSKITSHLIFLIFHLTIFYKTLFNMKLAIATSLFASAAAFAPSASKVRS